MKRSALVFGIIGLLTTFALASWGVTQEPAKSPKELLNPVEVLTRGPVHEAFAQPFDINPEPGPAVPKEPPPAINEKPAEQKPEADSAQWIPGYWSWDPDRKDYIWVSGVYRVPPQNRQYVPGYWAKSSDGWRWVQGFWSNPGQDLAYTPEPPATLDNGPQTQAPDSNSTYIPGAWVYRDDRFVWRPGYWAPYQQGRVWNPPQYMWTPNGYLFVDGYWDYPFQDRGLLYAPAYFNQPLWQNPGYSYQPNYLVGLGGFFNSPFLYNNGFWFGNYYGPRYAGLGYRPWYSGRGRYDPIFTHYAHGNPNWNVASAQRAFAAHSAGTLAGPPMTLAQQNGLANTKGFTPVVTPANQFKSNQVRVVNATASQLQTQQALAQHTRQVAAQRQQLANNGKLSTGSTVRFNSLSTAKSSGGPMIVNRAPAVHYGAGTSMHTGGVGSGPHIINQSPSHGVVNGRIINSPGYSSSMHSAPSARYAAPQMHYSAPRMAAPAHHAPAHMGGGRHR